MVGNHQLLGQTITDKSGTYRITYTVQRSAVAEIATADAKVIVLGPDDVEIAASDVVFNAPVDQVIDIVVQPGNFRGPSEHRRNRGDLSS